MSPSKPSPSRAPHEGPPAFSSERAWIAAVLIGGAAVLLPIWDVLDRQALLSALAGSGLGASAGVPFPLGLIGYPVLGLLLALSVRRALRASKSAAGYVIAATALWTAYYALTTANHTACTRSHAIDGWNVCEQPGRTPSGHGAFVSTSKRRILFDGPHLENGDPCVREDEHREIHLRESPDGDFADGLVQIWKRFPKDRARVLGGTLVALGALVAGALMALRRRGAA